MRPGRLRSLLCLLGHVKASFLRGRWPAWGFLLRDWRRRATCRECGALFRLTDYPAVFGLEDGGYVGVCSDCHDAFRENQRQQTMLL